MGIDDDCDIASLRVLFSRYLVPVDGYSVWYNVTSHCIKVAKCGDIECGDL